MSEFAPIAVFAYRRKTHLERTLDALEACRGYQESPVFIFSDGPKDPKSAASVHEVRELLHNRRRPNVTIVEAQENQGLARSIISGVTRLCRSHGRVIVIEDDIVLHPSALEWFNGALSAFADSKDIFQITAYQFRVPEFRGRAAGVLLPFTSSWGWATWERAWNNFDPDVRGWEQLNSDSALRHAYNLDDSFPMAEHLISRLSGHHDTWASRWYWALFKAKATAVFPPMSLVNNIGFDETATHNNIGWLKRFLAMPTPYEWEGSQAPDLPTSSNAADLNAFRRALRRTGAMRNTKIKSVLSQLGLWRGYS